MRDDASARPKVGFRPLLAVVATVWVITLLEFTRLPGALVRNEPINLIFAASHVFRLLAIYCAVPLAWITGMAILECEGVKRRLPASARAFFHFVLAGVVSFHTYTVLTQEPPFNEHRAFIAVPVTQAIFLIVVGALAGGLRGRGWRRLVHFVLPALTLAAGVATALLNYVIERHLYPTFHYSALLVALTLLGSGFIQVAGHGWAWLPRQRAISIPLVISCVAPLGLGALSFQDGETIRRYVHARTSLGQARLVANPTAETKAERRTRLIDSEGVARFATESGLPELPAEFVLEDYNILLVTIETLRGDATSMADPELDLTPNMAEFARAGAFAYSRAYSPSSGTLQSISSVMSMRPPAAVQLELSHTWKGRLRLAQQTAAEVMSSAGWSTFAVIHDHREVFTRRIKGLTQGFADQHLVLERKDSQSARTVDSRIVDETIEVLGQQREGNKPYFGWVFLASPHHPYVTYPKMGAAKSKRERYNQEIRNADEQLGRLIEALRDQGALADTIVIVAGDHGEEFGEHGGELHAGTLYEEVVHVPLLIWVPGLQGQVVERPVSLTYLLPWMLIKSKKKRIHQAARNSMRTFIGPVLRATEGAVLVELVGKARHFSAMIDGDLKLIYDHINEIFEGYDLAADPEETTDLVPEGDTRFEPMMERFERYRSVLEGYEAFRFIGPMPGDNNDDDDDDDSDKDKVGDDNRAKIVPGEKPGRSVGFPRLPAIPAQPTEVPVEAPPEGPPAPPKVHPSKKKQKTVPARMPRE